MTTTTKDDDDDEDDDKDDDDDDDNDDEDKWYPERQQTTKTNRAQTPSLLNPAGRWASLTVHFALRPPLGFNNSVWGGGMV